MWMHALKFTDRCLYDLQDDILYMIVIVFLLIFQAHFIDAYLIASSAS